MALTNDQELVALLNFLQYFFFKIRKQESDIVLFYLKHSPVNELRRNPLRCAV